MNDATSGLTVGSGGWRLPGWLIAALLLFSAAGLIASVLMWQRMGQLQSDVARRSADSSTQAVEARTLSQESQKLSLDNTARLGVLENQVKDLSLQRAQLETLVNQLSRTQDGNLVVEANAAIRLALQQMELTGSPEPLLDALRRARARLEQAGLPQLGGLQRAIDADIERLQSSDTVDTAGLQGRLDELLRLIDVMPLLNGVPGLGQGGADTVVLNNGSTMPAEGAAQHWWRSVWREVRQLVRVTRIDRPEAALIAPDQAYFLRESLKLKILNARVDLASRQYAQARTGLADMAALVGRYFDPASRTVQQVATVLQQAQAEVRDVQLPNIDRTLTALSAASHP